MMWKTRRVERLFSTRQHATDETLFTTRAETEAAILKYIDLIMYFIPLLASNSHSVSTFLNINHRYSHDVSRSLGHTSNFCFLSLSLYFTSSPSLPCSSLLLLLLQDSDSPRHSTASNSSTFSSPPSPASPHKTKSLSLESTDRMGWDT